MRPAPKQFALAATVLFAALASPPARAQSDVDRATARELGEAGERSLAAKDYKSAEEDFRRADSLVHAPTLMLGLARALAGEHKFLEAQEAYRRIIREGVSPGSPTVFQKAVEDARTEVDGVSSQVGAVTITVKSATGEPLPAGLQVSWDGAPVSAATLGVKRPADPGSHVIHVTCGGYQPLDLTVTVPVGGAVDAPLVLSRGASNGAAPAAATAPATTAPDASAPAAPDQTPVSSRGPGVWPWVAFGVGGAGLLVGGITGAMVISRHSDLSSKCPGGTCTPDEQSSVNSYDALGLVSTVGFVVAGVGAAAGVTMLLLMKPETDHAPAATGLHVTPVVGPGSVGAVGTF